MTQLKWVVEKKLMEELITPVTEKPGISEDQARTAVTTVTGFLKAKLPARIGGQIDNLLSGAGGVTDKLGDAAAKSWRPLRQVTTFMIECFS